MYFIGWIIEIKGGFLEGIWCLEQFYLYWGFSNDCGFEYIIDGKIYVVEVSNVLFVMIENLILMEFYDQFCLLILWDNLLNFFCFIE